MLDPGGPPPGRGLERLIPPGLVLLVAVLYARTGAFGFVNLDDQVYVYENPLVRQGLGWEALLGAFAQFRNGNWHPLTWLSHQLDVSLFGLEAGRHHLVNVLLHAVNAVLVFLWLARLTTRPWRAALVAALFAVHPLHVESVAWISERKDVLSTLFLLLSLLAWTAYRRRPALGWYLAALGAFALGLLSKPMVVTLPALLLLLDWWPERRPLTRALLLEKAPFAALSLAMVPVTWLAQSAGRATSTLDAVPPLVRVINAVVSAAHYLWSAAWPSGLAAFYPHPHLSGVSVAPWLVAAAAMVLTAVGVAGWQERERQPVLGFGLLWFLVTLLPVLGLVQVGVQARADRYTYVPLLGPFVAVVWLAAEALARRPRWRPLGAAGAAAAVMALSVASWQQVGFWRDSATLHRRSLAVTERNWMAWLGLADARSEAGDLAEAIEGYQRALEIRPDMASAWSGLGVVHGRAGRPDLALAPLEQAVRLDPALGEGWYNLGTALGALGRHGEARRAFERAVALRPDDARALANLGLAALLGGDRAAATACLERLRALDPAQAERLRDQLAAAAP